jgi:hypothetical protein
VASEVRDTLACAVLRCESSMLLCRRGDCDDAEQNNPGNTQWHLIWRENHVFLHVPFPSALYCVLKLYPRAVWGIETNQERTE